MNIVYLEPDDSIFTGEYEQKQGFGKCYICGVHGLITYTQNNKGQILERDQGMQ